ncbi:MAG TPA: excinuclease ABC subunit UvrA, partial [Candidatus Saccharimonadales bacterium]|nr:excinuclease ABC subunit UvrA [Candidatus Saccharimonadales bacterium]
IMVLAPIIDDKKGEHRSVVADLKKAGFSRVRVDGTVLDIDEFPELDKQRKHTVEAVVDRTTVDQGSRGRLTDSVEQALGIGDGVVNILEADSGKLRSFSERYACPVHREISLPEIAPRNFSFNSPHGACPHCTGLGTRLEVDPELVIPNRRLTLAEGAIRPWSRTTARVTWYTRLLEGVAKQCGFRWTRRSTK